MRERVDDSSESSHELEPSLERLQPRASSVSRDRLMFLAGREAAFRERAGSRKWRWPVATAASWLVTAAVAGLWMQSEPLGHQSRVVRKDQSPGKTELQSETEPIAHPETDVAQHSASSPVLKKIERSNEHSQPQTRESPRAPLWSLRSQRSFQRGSLLTVEALLDGDDQPRLSMVGWRSWDRERRSLDDTAPSAATESVEVPPATYSRLMKLYLDEQSAPRIQGDIL